MKEKIIQSTPLTIIDQTDSRKLEVYIQSNLPTVQIYNQNKSGSEVFTPNWTALGGLKLTASVFLDSREFNSYDQIEWYKNEISQANKITGAGKESLSNDNKTITILDNILLTEQIVTYICKVTYQGIGSFSQITFARVDAGRNGANGADGTSVRILGQAKSVSKLPDDIYYSIEYGDGAITATEIGDAYIYPEDGHLYVCAVLNGGEDGETDCFIDAGKIQGEKGAPARIITLTGSSQVFRVDKDGKIVSPSIIVVAAHYMNIDDPEEIEWEYRYNASGEWSSITSETANDAISLDDNVVMIDGSKLASNVTSVALRASCMGAEDVLTIYKAFDGSDGEHGVSAPIAFLTNENISFVADHNGIISTEQSVITHVVAYIGDKKILPQIGDLSVINAGLNLIGMNIEVDQDLTAQTDKEIVLKITVQSNVNLGSKESKQDGFDIHILSPVDTLLKLSWSKINDGAPGEPGQNGQTSYLHIAYATSADGNTGFSVSDSSGKTYIGQYTDHTKADSTNPSSYKWTLIKGDKGDQGVQGPKGDKGQQLYTWVKYADTPISGMSNNPDGKVYIGLAYNKDTATESSVYTDYMWSLIKGETGAVGPKGDQGQTYYTWIKYADSSSGANMSDSPTGKSYIGLAYNKTTSTESTTASDYTWSLFKGDKGDKGETGAAGADAYTVLLTNESHVFAGNVSSAVASNATTQILAYKGTSAQSITITSVNGVAAATASTATGIAGLSFACSALSGTSPTITFTCTTSFVSPSGTIPIVLSVGGVSITKMFTYSIAFKGSTGSASSSYWLVSNASAVKKTSSGDILCTPATLTFTGRTQTGTSAPTNYAGRWIIASSTDGTTYTDAYTSTANEATVSFTAASTYKSVRVRMYLAGDTTTLLDEQIIPFVSDGETGAVGATGDSAVTFQVYSNNGYALSAGTPTILLQTFAYFGDVEITAGATYQWYRYNGTDWVAVSNATNGYFNVSRYDVSFSNNYMCKMQFNGAEYVGVVTIDDKNDENKVFASKPNNYFSGDLWIVGTDYIPSGFAAGTMLRAEYSNSSYADSDWVSATKYDDEISDLQETVDEYKQYFSVDSANGLQVGDASINNNILTVETINTTTINAKEVEVESPLTVNGRYSGSTMLQAPTINLGNFSIVVESNGSLSFVANT